MDSKPRAIFATIGATAACAAAYFYGTGLHPHWYLTWIAPLPMLLLAPRVSRSYAAVAAFAAYVLGSLNMWSYYRMVTPLQVTLFILLGPAVIFTVVVLVFRALVLRRHLIRAALAVPAIWVALEYLAEFRSPHSTFGNLAYTQMDYLPILQMVSITGIWSISFLLFLLPAAIAAMSAPIAAVKQKLRIAVGTAVVFIVVIGYGLGRLHTGPAGPQVVVGLVDTDVNRTIFAKGPAAVELVRAYAQQIPLLAQQGAQVIIIPEKIGGFGPDEIAQTDRILSEAAAANRVSVVAGFQRLPNLNELRMYSPAGALEATYEKHHMLPIFEGDLLPGTARVLVDRPSGKWGLTICKDMDFPLLSRQYARDGAGLLLVPAWDFVADGWLHGRMAILRGVESGFSIARAPKEGILTVTDDRGRVLAQKVTGEEPFATLVASVPVKNEPTIYARNGDWFAWAGLALVVALLGWPMRRAEGTSI